MPVPELLRKHGISRQTFFNWRSRYGAASVKEFSQRIPDCSNAQSWRAWLIPRYSQRIEDTTPPGPA